MSGEGGRAENEATEERRKGQEIEGDESIHLILRSSHLMIAMSNTGWAEPVGTHKLLSRNVRKEPIKKQGKCWKE